MKLDVSRMRYLSKEDYRVLTAVEMGMRNHELVPVELISSIAKLRHGGIHKILSNLLRHKLLAHDSKKYNGYRLSYLGFDILALRTLLARGIISSVGAQIGVGKESDIFEAQNEDGDEIVIKLHRLGRTSFRSVRKNRDYMSGKSKASWLYMSRLAAVKEYAFMQALYRHGFPTPIPIDQNRHVVAMSRVSGFPMAQVKSGQMEGAGIVFEKCVKLLYKLTEHGLVHCDLNEFNIMVDQQFNVTMIDFPQMVSTNHVNAEELFYRDLRGLVKFFAMKMKFVPSDESVLNFSYVVSGEYRALRIANNEDYDNNVGNTNTTVVTSHSNDNNAVVRIDEEIEASGNGISAEDDAHLMNFIATEAAALADFEGDEDEIDEEPELIKNEEEQQELDNNVFGFASNATEAAVDDVSDYDSDQADLGLDYNEEDKEEDDDEEDDNEEENEEDSSTPAMSMGRGFNDFGGVTNDKLQDIRSQLRRGDRRGKGRGSSGGSRNMTKKINKYGKKVKNASLDINW